MSWGRCRYRCQPKRTGLSKERLLAELHDRDGAPIGDTRRPNGVAYLGEHAEAP